MIEIRKRKPEDAPALKEINRDTICTAAIDSYSQEVIDLWSSAVSEDDFKKTNPEWLHFVAVEGDAILGYVNFKKNGRVGGFYVHTDYRGQGVGSILMEHVLEFAKGLGLKKLDCLSSLNSEGFYKKHGFEFVEAKEHELSKSVSMTVHLLEKSLV